MQGFWRKICKIRLNFETCILKHEELEIGFSCFFCFVMKTSVSMFEDFRTSPICLLSEVVNEINV